MAAWPKQNDLDLILSAPVGSLGLFHGMVFTPYSDFVHQGLPSPRELLQVPLPGSHPVLLARRLLTLGVFLQSFTPAATQQLAGRLSTSPQDIMFGVVEMASRLVNSNDDLVGTVEGVECILMEAMYQNNLGNLRSAYLAMRRALAIAQMIGLEQGPSSPLLRVLELDTRKRVRPEYMWFRIVQSDRYLSLMLGLPQGSVDDGFAAPGLMQEYTATERMEHILTLAAGKLIRRNHLGMHDLEVTREIDRLLLDGAASQSPQWWLPPDLPSADNEEAKVLHNTARIMSQFTHYHLLGQLHLPYLLHPSIDRKYDYNRITAVTASRELLSRFISFRCSQSEVASFCRGVDFLAFIASTALCLGHIHSRLRHNGSDIQVDNVLEFLFHQRLSDRGILEQTLECMEKVARLNSADEIATKVARNLRYLLAVEADVANGDCYRTDMSYGANEELDCKGKLSDGGILQIYLPHLGTIRIQRSDTTKATSGSTVPVSTREDIATFPGIFEESYIPVGSRDPAMQGEHERRQHAAAVQVADRCAGVQLNAASPGWLGDSFELHEDGSRNRPLSVPVSESGDNGALQDVDFAFLSSLFPQNGEPS